MQPPPKSIIRLLEHIMRLAPERCRELLDSTPQMSREDAVAVFDLTGMVDFAAAVFVHDDKETQRAVAGARSSAFGESENLSFLSRLITKEKAAERYTSIRNGILRETPPGALLTVFDFGDYCSVTATPLDGPLNT